MTLRWIVAFVFDKAGWVDDQVLTDDLADALAATSLWTLVEFVGQDYDSGVPRDDAGELRALLRTGKSRYAFVRGSKRAATFVDETDVALQVEVNPAFLTVKGLASKTALRDLGPKALDDFIEVTSKLARTFADVGQLVRGHAWVDSRAFPDLGSQSSWPLWALADAVEPHRPPMHAADPFVAPSNAIAAASAPAGVRVESGRVTVLRWTTDPSDLAAVEKAALRRADWMRSVLPADPVG